MPQFTPKTLARVLLNVERNVLRQAVTEADLWDLFSSFERDAIVQIGEEQNLLANLRTFGPAALELLGEQFFERVETLAAGAPMIARLQFQAAERTWSLVNDVRDRVNSIVEFFSEETVDVTPNLEAALEELEQLAQNFRFHIATEQWSVTAMKQSQNVLGRAISHITAALAATG